MTTGLLLYTDGEIREIDLDLDRPDVICQTLSTADPLRVNVDGSDAHPDDRAAFLIDRYAARALAPINVYATLYVFASHRRPFHGIHGTALLLGVTADGELTDAPDALVAIMRKLSEIPPT